MQKHELKNLKRAHKEYLEKYREQGFAILSYRTPCCGGAMQTPAAIEGEKWDSGVTCFYCGSSYRRETTSTTVNIK